MSKRNIDTDPWVLGEDIPDCDLYFSQIWLSAFVNSFEKNTGRAYQKILCKYEGYHLWFYFGEKDSLEVGENIANRIINEPGYADSVNANILVEADKLRDFSETIPQKDLQKLSNEELWKIYHTQDTIHSDYYNWCWIPVAADMFHGNLSKRVKEYLRKHAEGAEAVNAAFVTLTQPTKKSLIFLEQEALLKIAIDIEKDAETKKIFQTEKSNTIFEQLPKNFQERIQAHRDSYYYTKHLWVTGEFTVSDYIHQLQDILNGDLTAEYILQKQYDDLERAKNDRAALMQQLNIDGQWRNIFDNFGDFMVTKIYRRYAQLLAVHHMSAILKEIARRFYLTEKQVRCMLPQEVEAMLLQKSYDEEELLKRTRMCVYYAEKNIDRVVTGKEAEELLEEIDHTIDENVSEFTGDIGCGGKARGTVKIIIRAEDMQKMRSGDVLVSIATDPDIVPAMKKAAAIITEQGGVTSHAAIVSRELNIPCVIGTKIATRVLKDGDIVEVDANAGIVKILKK